MAAEQQHINAVLTCDESGTIMTANKDCELLFNQPSSQIIGAILSEKIQLESVVNIQQHLAAVNDAAQMNAHGKAIIAKNTGNNQAIELLAWLIDDDNNKKKQTKHTYLCHLKIIPSNSGNTETNGSNNSLIEIIDDLQKNSISDRGAHYVFGRGLDALLEYTQSEYGFIGEILHNADEEPYLQTHAITNIAWNDETRSFFEKSAPSGFAFFNNNTLFGQTVTKGEVVIANTPKEHPKSGGLPEGHPELNHYLGLPIRCNNELVGMIGISNRPNGYTQEIVDDLYFLMNFLGFLIKSYQNDRKRKFIESKLQIQSKELNEANDLLRAVYESNRDIQFLLDIDGVIINYQVHDNKDLYLTPEEFIGKKLHDVLPIQVAEQFKNAFDEAISSNSLVSFDYILPMPSGDCTYNARIISLKDKRIVVTARDITESKQLLVELEAVKEYYSLLLDASPSGIWHTKTNGDNIYVSPKWTEITGVSAVDAKGTGWSDSIHAEDKERVYLDWVVATENEMAYQSEFRFVRPDGIIKWVVSVGSPEKRNNKVVSWIGTITDITPIKAYQGQLEHIAHYDVLTNLPNRVLLADRLNHAILQCQRRNQSLAVAFMDLDGFKVVNDTYGHDLGDKLLVELSKRMKEALREGDTLARIGGDEFIAIMVDLDDTDDKEPVLERLLKVAAEPITLGDSVVQVSLSIGVTLYPQDGADADQLMRHADQAMYVAKQAGKNQYQLFDAAQDSGVNIRRQNIADVDSALDRLEFVLHYQPKVNMHTSEVIGVEALIRWQHPVRGLVPPLDFLPAIDGHAISLELGEWVIDTALSQINQWRSMGVELPISVNISAYQLQQRNFSNRLALLLAAHTEVDPNYLELEILESSELSDISQVFDTMSACHDLGVRFALDDFGTGYSSLTHIKRLPAYLIKIDQSFVRDMLEDLDDLAIIESVIGLAKTFKREVIAEGVETIEQGVALLKLGCELAQGYGIARPMTAGDIPEWISNWKADDSWQAHNLIETN